MIIPPYLKQGDTAAIVCPAGKVPGDIDDALNLLVSWGLRVVTGESVHASFHQFAGDDETRATDFQRMLDDDDVKVIFAARGGYGTVRMIDRIDFAHFSSRPKWIVGFSDITVLHSHIQANYGIPTIHGQMPLTIPEGTRESLDTLRRVLFGESVFYQYRSDHDHIAGSATGKLIGGNLALLASVVGSVSDPDYDGAILFLEDVGEYLYSVDRMMWMLKRSGKLAGLRGMIVGGFTSLKDNDIPFGFTVEEIILEKVAAYGYPVAFGFPAGHIRDNQALVLGREVELSVSGKTVALHYASK